MVDLPNDDTVFARLDVKPDEPSPGSRLGVALSTLSLLPVNGLRHPADGDTNGWYIWCGEWSDSDDFFESLHVEHIGEYLPQVMQYLGLPPGYRFLIDDKGHEDFGSSQVSLRFHR